MKQKLSFKILIAIIISIFCAFTFLFIIQNITNNKTDLFDLASVNGGVLPTILKDENKQTYYINGKIANKPATSNIIVKQQLNNLKGVVTLGNTENNLELVSEQKIKSSRVYRFAQKHEGIPVYGKQVIAVSNENNYINQVVLDISENLKVSTVPIYSKNEIVSELLNTAEYAQSYVVNVNLVVYNLYNFAPTLAYAVTIETESENLLQYSDVIINANTKEIVVNIPLSTASISSTQTDGLGNSRDVEITYNDETKKYYLADETRNIFVYDAKNSTSGSVNLVDSNNQTFADPYAVSLFANLKDCYDFYKDKTNIGVSLNGPDNMGMEVVGIIHFGTNYENAAWVTGDGLPTDSNPDKNEGYIAVGDGGYTFKNLSMGLDVLGHEYQHAVTTYTAGLIYFNASGALDEGFSNLFGALIENKTGQDFWTIGEDIMKNAPCLYDLSNPHGSLTPAPTSLSDSYFQPFCYKTHSHDHCDYGGVHTNSSIITYAAYKMAQENPEFFTNQKLGELFYNTLIMLPKAASFNHARVACVTAATSLGYDVQVIDTIKQAFTSVGVMGEDAPLSITYNANGATKGKVPDNTIGKFNKQIIVSNNINELAKDNYVFYCWNTNSTGTGTDYYAGDTITITEDITLYVKWIRGLWAGETTSNFSVGNGTVQNPYVVASTGELAYLAFVVNNNFKDYINGNYYKDKHYKLANNLDVTKENWVPIGNSENPFSGTFYGNGHKVTLLIKNNEFVKAGLFGNINNAKIVGVGIYGTATGHKSYIGSVASVAKNSVITNCYSNLNIEENLSFGGIVETLENGTIANCYFTGTSKAGMATGGIVSVLKNSNIFNSYNSGNLFASTTCGGIVADMYGGKIVNCFNVGSINNAFNRGGLVGKVRESSGDVSKIENCVNYGTVNYSSGTLFYAGGIVGVDSADNTKFQNNIFKIYTNLSASGNANLTQEQQNNIGQSCNDEYMAGKFNFDEISFYESLLNNEEEGTTKFDFGLTWTFNTNVAITQPSFGLPVLNFAPNWESVKSTRLSGYGTDANPYLIQSANDLAFLSYAVNANLKNANNINYATCNYSVTKNINLKGLYFNVIGLNNAFEGKFNGNYHTISNLQENGENNLSLFGNVKNGTIKNLSIENSKIIAYGTENVSALANVITNSVINNVYISGSFIGNVASGIVNVSNNSQISNVAVNGNIYGTQNASGIGNALNFSTLTNAYCKGAVYGAGTVAGIASETSGNIYIKNVLQTSSVKSQSQSVNNIIGGIVGIITVNDNVVNIDSAISIGKITNNNSATVGGAVGKVIDESNLLTLDNCQTNHATLVGEYYNTISNSIQINNKVNALLKFNDVMLNMFTNLIWKENAWDETIWKVKNNSLILSKFNYQNKIVFLQKPNLKFIDIIGNEIISEKEVLVTNGNVYQFKVSAEKNVNVTRNEHLIHPNSEGVYSVVINEDVVIKATEKRAVTYNVSNNYVIPLLQDVDYKSNLFYFIINKLDNFNYDNLKVYANGRLLSEINNNVYVADYSLENVNITVEGVHSNTKYYVTLENSLTDQLVKLANYNNFIYEGTDLLINVSVLNKYDYSNMKVYANNELVEKIGEYYVVKNVQSDLSVKLVGVTNKVLQVRVNTLSRPFVKLTSNKIIYSENATFTIQTLLGYDYKKLQVYVNGKLLMPNEEGVYTVLNVTNDVVIDVQGVTPVNDNAFNFKYFAIAAICLCIIAFSVYISFRKKQNNK